jgi:hypothetical protein
MMEPLKPEDKARILRENPQADPGDIEEYELLLSRRFTVDPDLPAKPGDASAAEAIQSRLAYLHRKLFPQAYFEFSR